MSLLLKLLLYTALSISTSSANVFLKLQDGKDSVYTVEMELTERGESEIHANLKSHFICRLGRKSTELVAYVLQFQDKANEYFHLTDIDKWQLSHPFLIEFGLEDEPSYRFRRTESDPVMDVKYVISSKLVGYPRELRWRAAGNHSNFNIKVDVVEIMGKNCDATVTIAQLPTQYKIHLDVNVAACDTQSQTGHYLGSSSSYVVDLHYTKPKFELVDVNSKMTLNYLNKNDQSQVDLVLMQRIYIYFEGFEKIYKDMRLDDYETIEK